MMTIHTFRAYCRHQEARIRRLLDQYGCKVRPSETANVNIYNRRRDTDFDTLLTKLAQNRVTTRGLSHTAPRTRKRR